MEGNIIVDGVLASCYPSGDHDLVHFGMAPLIWFPNKMDSLFGVEKGFSLYVAIHEEIAKWYVPYGQMYGTSSCKVKE